jgi:hypothetical protein
VLARRVVEVRGREERESLGGDIWGNTDARACAGSGGGIEEYKVGFWLG